MHIMWNVDEQQSESTTNAGFIADKQP
jgi:hypothetical protein